MARWIDPFDLPYMSTKEELEALEKAALLEMQSSRYDRPPSIKSPYKKNIKGVEVDVYDVLVAFNVTCPATQHAIKKLLCAGKRGAKGTHQDLDEAIQAIERAKEIPPF